MNKIAIAFSQTRTAEAALADAWLRVGERQSADHEWFHNANRFNVQCKEHIEELARFAPRYGTHMEEKDDTEFFHGMMGKLRHKVSELVGRRPESGILLMRDQRLIFTLGYATGFHWMVMGQIAQAMRDDELLTMVDHNHKDILTQIKWVKSEIKAASPQVFCS